MTVTADDVSFRTSDKARCSEHFDVLIIGAGVSGIGSARYLVSQCPDTSFVVLEAQPGFGGTWRTHRYPGIRSDSDLFTYGYAFKPWDGPAIASAAEIRDYLSEVIAENDLSSHIRYQHTVTAAQWSTEHNHWTVVAKQTESGETTRLTANFLWMCQGYYRHSEGYTPSWEGMEEFRGRIVHPQTWPKDLDLKGKNVLVIGSGSTAVTLIPAIAGDSAHVTMLQRSPSYFVTEFDGEAFAKELRALDIEKSWLHEIMRRKVFRDDALFTERTFREPDVVKRELIENVRGHLDPDFDVETHFTPSYRPWRQRICLVQDGDFFRAIRAGKVSVVTDHIARFTETGIRLESGTDIAADIIVTSTGFQLSLFGDIAFSIDGAPLDFSETITYRGMMFSGVPNMAWVYGYFRSSWTPRVDLVGGFVCRLLHHMAMIGARRVVPTLRQEDKTMTLSQWFDPEDINAGYLLRGLHLFPRRGDRAEWRHSEDLLTDERTIPQIDLDDGTLVYGA